MSNARTRMIVAVAGVLVVAAAFFFMFVKPRQAALGEVRESVEVAEQETMRLQSELGRLQALQENAPQLEARLAEVRGQVPQEAEVANFVFQVQDVANRSGVDFVQITPELPKPPPEGAEVAEIRVTVGARGGYFAVQDFVRRLYSLDRSLRIDNFDMQAEEDEDTGMYEVSFTSVARIFFELPPGGVTGSVPAPAAAPVEDATGTETGTETESEPATSEG